MQKIRVLTVPAKGAPPLVIRCTMMTEAMTIVEDGAGNGGAQQGILYALLTPTNSATANAWTQGPLANPTFSLAPIVIQQKANDHSPNRIPIGGPGSFPNPVSPGGPVTNGTPVVAVTSASALTTTIDVIEE